jgi:hypothetical protein
MDQDRGSGGPGAVTVDVQEVARAGRAVRQVRDPFDGAAAAEEGAEQDAPVRQAA